MSALFEEESLQQRLTRVLWMDFIGVHKASLVGKDSNSSAMGDGKVLLKEFRLLMDAAELLDISVSDNESLEDVTTVNLQILLLPYAIGDLIYNCTPYHISTRAETLREVHRLWQSFLDSLRLLGLESAGLLECFSDPRTRKIEMLRKQSVLRSSVIQLHNHCAREYRITDDDREAMLSALQYFYNQCESELVLVLSELDMVKFHHEESRLFSDGKGYEPVEITKKKPWSVKLTDKSQIRKMFADSVFRPDISMPTMSLEEFAKIEMQNMIRSSNVKQQPIDDLQEEQQELKDRAWDDWKDDNPRGSGNKLSNIG